MTDQMPEASDRHCAACGSPPLELARRALQSRLSRARAAQGLQHVAGDDHGALVWAQRASALLFALQSLEEINESAK